MKRRNYRLLNAEQEQVSPETITAETETVLDEGVLSSFDEPLAKLSEIAKEDNTVDFVQSLKELIEIGAKTFGAENIIPDGIWREIADATADVANEVSGSVIDEAINQAIRQMQEQKKDEVGIAVPPSNLTTAASRKTRPTKGGVQMNTTDRREILTLKSDLSALKSEIQKDKEMEEKATNRVLLTQKLDKLIKARKMEAAQKDEIMGLFEEGREDEVIAATKIIMISSPRPNVNGLNANLSPYPTRVETTQEGTPIALYEHNVTPVEEAKKALITASKQQLADHYAATNYNARPKWTTVEEADAYRDALLTNLQLANGRR